MIKPLFDKTRLLFADELAPITETIGFLETDYPLAAQAFMDWMAPIHKKRGITLEKRLVSGNLKEILLSLLPLTSVERRRYLFIPTTSSWVAFFDNGHQGTDAVSVVSYLAQQIGCRGLRITVSPDTVEGEFKEARGRYGAIMLEVYGPQKTDFLNYVRAINVTNDGGRWVFHQSGTPFSFERLEQYQVRRIKERFTFDLLETYLKELGLSPFDQNFYLPQPNSVAELVEKKGPVAPKLKEYTLAQVRSRF